jgi:hypothetical protein
VFRSRPRSRPASAGEVVGAARGDEQREACRDQGRGAESRALLSPVCDWLTEGFDTLDLGRAKALLGDLAQ